MIFGANEDAEKIRFKERSEGERPEHEVKLLKKLLLPGTNPKIDKEKEGELNPEGFFKMSKIVKLSKLFKIQNSEIQNGKLSHHRYFNDTFMPNTEKKENCICY